MFWHNPKLSPTVLLRLPLNFLKSNSVKIKHLTNTQGSSIFFGGGTDRTEIYNNILHNSISNGINVNDVGFGPNNNIRAKNNNIQGE
jgi:hypothetical protein